MDSEETSHAHVQRRKHTSRIPKSRTEAFKSFENLVALANDTERWDFHRLNKVGKQLVWRDTGEPPVLLETLTECFEHAATGGLRAGGLAFGARSGFNIILLLFNYARAPKKFRATLIRYALFGEDSFRFAAMLGSFVGLYKFILNALPIILLRLEEAKEDRIGAILPLSYHNEPLPEPDDETTDGSEPKFHLQEDSSYSHSYATSDSEAFDTEEGLTTPASSRFSALRMTGIVPSIPSKLVSPKHAHFNQDPVVFVPPGHLSESTKANLKIAKDRGFVYKRWHAALAGAVAGGTAILTEKKVRRLGIAQQLFVRGLQGTFNIWSERTGITVPFGSVVVFSLCCAQIMYGYLIRPDTIPRGYVSWIQSASAVPEQGVAINRQLFSEGRFDVELLDALANGRGTPWVHGRSATIYTPTAREAMLDQLKQVRDGTWNYSPMATCACIHPHRDSCLETGFMRIFEVGKWMAPVYAALHFVPMLLFKRKALLKEPTKMIIRSVIGTLRSSAFLGVYVCIYQSYFCLIQALRNLPVSEPMLKRIRNIAPSKPIWWIGGLLSGLSLLVEDPRRRQELAMYVLPKGLEGGWKLFRGKVFGIPTKRKRGWKSDSLLCAAGMGMVMSTYQYDPHHLSGLVRRLLYQFVGPN